MLWFFLVSTPHLVSTPCAAALEKQSSTRYLLTVCSWFKYPYHHALRQEGLNARQEYWFSSDVKPMILKSPCDCNRPPYCSAQLQGGTYIYIYMVQHSSTLPVAVYILFLSALINSCYYIANVLFLVTIRCHRDSDDSSPCFFLSHVKCSTPPARRFACVEFNFWPVPLYYLFVAFIVLQCFTFGFWAIGWFTPLHIMHTWVLHTPAH